jgi:phosphatidate cytidylyltransferase
VLWSTIAINILSRADFFLCPQKRNALGYVPFDGMKTLTCSEEVKEPFFRVMFTIGSVSLTALQCHAMVLALFASLLAPFGGFFASGFKRAFKIKDFGDSIPGHGGITDRFDCQVVMGAFTALYLGAFVYTESKQLGLKDILDALGTLTVSEKKNLRDALAYELRGV